MSNIIDSIQLSGVTYTLSGSGSGNATVELTQAEYDALVSAGTVSANTYYIINDALGVNVTSAVTSGSTDVVTSGGVYDALNGLKLAKITAADYALITPDANTVYFIGDSNGYIMKLGSVSIS